MRQTSPSSWHLIYKLFPQHPKQAHEKIIEINRHNKNIQINFYFRLHRATVCNTEVTNVYIVKKISSESENI